MFGVSKSISQNGNFKFIFPSLEASLVGKLCNIPSYPTLSSFFSKFELDMGDFLVTTVSNDCSFIDDSFKFGNEENSYSQFGVLGLGDLSANSNGEFEQYSSQYDGFTPSSFISRVVMEATCNCIQEMNKTDPTNSIFFDGFPSGFLQDGIIRGAISGLYGDSSKYDENFIETISDWGLINTRETRGYHLGLMESLTKYLASTPANLMTPQIFCDSISKVNEKLLSNDRESPVKISIFDENWIHSNGFQLLESVSKGSEIPPRLLQAEYFGNPESSEIDFCIVGKGITFDSGGYNLKGSNGMGDMKMDMAGAAASMSSLLSLALEEIPVNVVAVAPLCENLINGKSNKPGDVVGSFIGKTVEIGNTDAEGRLILADALAYCCQTFSPSTIIDVATLTGSMEAALGQITGVFSNSHSLWEDCLQSSFETGTDVWRIPVLEEHTKRLESNFADLNNIQSQSNSGACVGAAFLGQFVDGRDWIHLDIAGGFGEKCLNGSISSLLFELCSRNV